MGVNHAHSHEEERVPPGELARDRAERFARALEAVMREHARALALAERAEDPT